MSVPALRFKDDDGKEFPEWEEKTLGEVADSNIKWSLTGGPFGSNLKAEDYTNSGIRIIQLQNIGDGIFNDEYKIYTSAQKADELLSCNIFPSEIIISKMGDPVARCCIMPDTHNRYLMASDGIRLVVNKAIFSVGFIHYLINHSTFRKNAIEVSTGTTRRRIGLNELRNLPVIYSSLPEQTKIANFLTAVDDKISLLTQKATLLSQYKKGVMQQIFKQELRFKDDDGQEFPEWEEKTLGEITETIQSGKSKGRQDVGEYPLYGSTGVIGFSDSSQYEGKTILIARVGANAGFIYEVDGNYSVSDNTIILVLKKPNNYSFFFNLLTKFRLNQLVFGSGQPLITGGQLNL